ncbi:E3 ubiquitin-protein ligase ubr1 [Cryptotrichosporon argae]
MSEHHHHLFETLHYGHEAHPTTTYDVEARARLVRALYATVFHRPEWQALFAIPGEADRLPRLDALDGWVVLDERKAEAAWSVYEYQLRAEERRRRLGKETTRTRRKGATCGRVLQRLERTYSCKTCASDSSCILCVDCYRAGDHEGHEVLFGQSFTFSAACDCGDTSAWKDNAHLGCAAHPRGTPGAEPEMPRRFPTDVPAIGNDLIQALHDTITIALEYVLIVFQASPMPSEYGRLPATVADMLGETEGEPHEQSQPHERSQAQGPWAVTAYADDKHVLKEVTRQIRDAIGCDWADASRYAKDMEEAGRKTITVSDSHVFAFHVANMFQQIDLGVTLRPAVDTFREEAAGTVLAWLADMSRTAIAGDDAVFTRLLMRALGEPRTIPSAPGLPIPSDLADLGPDANRIDWLLRLDVRMWKAAKWDMRQIYSRGYTLDAASRRTFTCHFTRNYVRILEYYVFQDRDLDSFLAFSLAYMVLGNGSACAYASVQNPSLLLTVLDTTQAFYCNQHTGGRINTADEPGRTARRLDIDADNFAFRGKKGMTLFGHLRALCRHADIQRLIAANGAVFERALGFLNLFVGLQPQRRETGAHVEYEVEWVKSFAVLPDLVKLAKELGESFRFAAPAQVLDGMATVIRRITGDLLLQTPTLDPKRFVPPVMHDVADVLVQGTRHTLLKVSVMRLEAFSFHHHLHLTLAEMVRSFPPPETNETMRVVFERDVLRKVPAMSEGDVERLKLIMLEWSLQMHVVLPQIRLGLWAKNGMAMRAQYHHYRDVTMRDFTVDQEFYLLQFGLCVMDQQKFVTALIDRFGLSNFFRLDVTAREIWASSTEPQYRISLYEELVLLLIHLVMDTSAVNKLGQAAMTRQHIVHLLALNSLTYSDMLKRLPERSTEKGSLIPILDEVADFREPTDTAPGIYALKPDLYTEVDPYWHHYNRNEMREAVERLHARAKKDRPDAPEPLVRPQRIRLPERPLPFSDLADWLATTTATAFVHWTIAHCMIMAEPDNWPGALLPGNIPTGYKMPQYDALLDLVLHLSIMCLDVDADFFAVQSVEIVEASGAMSTFQNLWFMQTHEAFKSFLPKVDHILARIVDHLPESYTVDYRAQRAAAAVDKAPTGGKAADAKATAQARQKALMASFAKQQADFAATWDDEDEDEAGVADDDVPASYGSCIVCQEVVHAGKTGGMLAYLQPSRIMRDAVVDRDWLEEAVLTPCDLDRDTRELRLGMGTGAGPSTTEAYPSASNRLGVYVSACNHLMHETCMVAYNDLTRARQAQQVQRHQPENAARHEYMCPLCKTLGNVLIPLDPTATAMRPMPRSKINPALPPSLSERIRSVSEEGLLRVSDSAKIWDHHCETGELTPWFTDHSFMIFSLDMNHRKQHMRAIGRMVERVRGLTRPLSEQSQRIRQKKTHMYLPDDMVGYTVAVCEVAQRGLASAGATVAEQVPETSIKVIKHLIGMLQLELDLFFGPRVDRTALRVGIFARFLPDWYRSATLPTPLLLRQPLGIVVEAAAIAPDLLHATLVMAYYAELTRVLLAVVVYIRRCLVHRSAAGAQPRPSPPPDASLPHALAVFPNSKALVAHVLRAAGPFADIDGALALVAEHTLSKLVYSFTLPFLRRAAIVYYAVAGTYPVPDAPLRPDMCEYDRLLGLLGVPRPTETLSNAHSTETPIVNRWLSQWAMQGRVLPALEFPGTYELIRLPDAYEVASIKFAKTRCDRCGTRPNHPALCMYCGKFLCLGSDCCADGEQGECNLHMRECGAVSGMFLDIRRWTILYLFAGSGSFGPMPYLDTFGELDPSLRRGHRQYMHRGRMEDLRRNMWLQHALPTLCARKLELTSDGGGWSCL